MQRNIKVPHVLGLSIKTCGSFLKYVVAAQQVKVFHTVLADGKMVN